MKIHVLGAPGAGVTTLGKAIAESISAAHFDVDDFYWFTSDPLPYKRKRNPDHRRQLLETSLNSTDNWVLSGALCSWGDCFIPDFQLVIYVNTDTDLRLSRIRAREESRYGAAAINTGGALHVVFEKFLNWAAQYELPTENIRSKSWELNWVSQLPCAVLEVDSAPPLTHYLPRLLEQIKAITPD